MATVVQTKHALRNAIAKHGLKLARMNVDSAVWGIGARTNAWRLTSHLSHPSTSKAAVDLILFPPSLGQRVVEVALREVGTKEHPAGSNDGPRVHEYQSVTGAYHAPWCASFCCWCYRRAGFKGDFAQLPAYVPSWTSMVKGRQRGWRPVDFRDARAGDIVTLWQSGHIEIVRQRSGEYLECIGGNTSPVGQNANGGMVAKTRRHSSEITVIGRHG